MSQKSSFLEPALRGMESGCESKALVAADQRPLTSVVGHHGILVPRLIADRLAPRRRRYLLSLSSPTNLRHTPEYDHPKQLPGRLRVWQFRGDSSRCTKARWRAGLPGLQIPRQ